MAFQINGFYPAPVQTAVEYTPPQVMRGEPRRSLVRVHFPNSSTTLSYYNERFDLKPEDVVYVEGKMAGQLGLVQDVSYNFKIRRSDYKQVIALVDPTVHGEFFIAESHFVTFDPAALTAEQAIPWFRAPAAEDEEYIVSCDGESFPLNDLSGLKVSPVIAQRGRDYYLENRVLALFLEGSRGQAIVEGSQCYTVEFTYRDGQISALTCDCPCGYACKHQYAAMLQLRETLDLVEQHYADHFRRTGHLAAISKSVFFHFAIMSRKTGSFSL